MDRRDFLGALLAAVPATMVSCRPENNEPAADRIGELLPRRILGRTGEAVTMLGVGGYHVGWTTERDAQEVIETALENGVRFFDTAESYQDGRSESRYGNFLTPKYRDLVFLMSKTTGRDADTVRRHLDESLQRLQTDYLDLWQVHSLQDPEDVDSRIRSGVLDVFEEAKAAGKVRYIGFTGHRNPAAHRRMLEQTARSQLFDTCQMPVNVLDPSFHSFIESVAPALVERNIGLLAMKTLADGRFFAEKRRLDDVQWQTESPVVPDRVSVEEALGFAWSLPVSVLITGAENASLMREKANMARAFVKLDDEARSGLVERVADLAEDGRIEYFKQIES